MILEYTTLLWKLLALFIMLLLALFWGVMQLVNGIDKVIRIVPLLSELF